MIKTHGATILDDRKEIGLAMNFGKYPVLWMEIGKSPKGYESQMYEGCKATIISKTRSCGDLRYTGELAMFADEQDVSVLPCPWLWDHIKLKNYGTCIKSVFGYSDVIEDLENANTPILETNQEVVVVFKDSVERKCVVRKMVTSGRIDPHCYTMMSIENVKEDEA